MWERVILLIIYSFTYFFKKMNTKEILLTLKKIKFNLFFCMLYSICLLLAFFSIPLFLLLPRNIWNLRHGARVLKHLTFLCNITWELRNGEVLSKSGSAIIVSNHQFSLDVLGMFNVWHKVDKLTPIAKSDFLYALPFGLAAYLAGVVFINSSNKEDAFKKLDDTAIEMMKKQVKIWIFPEGKRNPDGRQFLPFKKGAFHMAVSAQVPIIPVVYSPYYFIDSKKYTFSKGHVVLKCLEPISTKGLTRNDLQDLIDCVRDKMAETYKELTHEVTEAIHHT